MSRAAPELGTDHPLNVGSSIEQRAREIDREMKNSGRSMYMASDSQPDIPCTFYLNHSFIASPDTLQTENFLYTAEEGYAQWSRTSECFFLKYKRPGEEISVKQLISRNCGQIHKKVLV